MTIDVLFNIRNNIETWGFFFFFAMGFFNTNDGRLSNYTYTQHTQTVSLLPRLYSLSLSVSWFIHLFTSGSRRLSCLFFIIEKSMTCLFCFLFLFIPFFFYLFYFGFFDCLLLFCFLYSFCCLPHCLPSDFHTLLLSAFLFCSFEKKRNLKKNEKTCRSSRNAWHFFIILSYNLLRGRTPISVSIYNTAVYPLLSLLARRSSHSRFRCPVRHSALETSEVHLLHQKPRERSTKKRTPRRFHLT